MANLIITIISIALVAVAAIMGAYYGGAAFQEGQAKGVANQYINAGQQWAAAFNVYSASNAGTTRIDGMKYINTGDWLYANGTGTQLVPTYLSSFPILPDNYGFQCGLANASGATVANCFYSIGTNASVAFVIAAKVASNSVCTQIAKIAGGPSASTIDGGTNVYLPRNGWKFDCYNSATIGSNIFVYRAI